MQNVGGESLPFRIGGVGDDQKTSTDICPGSRITAMLDGGLAEYGIQRGIRRVELIGNATRATRGDLAASAHPDGRSMRLYRPR